MTDVFGNYVIQKFFEVRTVFKVDLDLNRYKTRETFLSMCTKYFVLCDAVWECRPEAGFGNTYPWTRPSPGFADVRLQSYSESLGVHFL